MLSEEKRKQENAMPFQPELNPMVGSWTTDFVDLHVDHRARKKKEPKGDLTGFGCARIRRCSDGEGAAARKGLNG